MSDANLTRLLYAIEDTFGVLPVAPPALTELRFLSSSLAHEKLTVMSEEIRADRSRSKLIEVGKNAAGSIETELIIGDFNDLILGALLATAWTSGQATGTGSLVVVDGVGTITLSVGTFSAAAQQAKMVRVAGFATAANNGVKRVVSCNSTVLVLANMSTNEAGVAGLTFDYQYARNGVTLTTFLIEQQYLSLDPAHYIYFSGCSVNQWDLNMEAQARVLQSFAIMGARAYSDTDSVGNGSPVVPTRRNILNTTGNIGGLVWDGAAMTENVMGFTMAMLNNLRNRPALSRETTLVHGKGLCEPNGTINVYFETPDLFEKFINHEAASLFMPLTDIDGNSMSLFFPQLEFPTGFPTIGGINTDVMLPLDWNATHHEASGFTVQVDQLDAEGAGSSS